MNMQPQPPDLVEIKKRQQRAWASGDYAMFGAALLIISELLCEAVDLRPGQKVLDVATGSGNEAGSGPPPNGLRSRFGRATLRNSRSRTPLSTSCSRPSG
jgi:hypothetical protein